MGKLQKNKRDELPEITKEDMQLISQPLDFHGQNIYNAVEIRADANAENGISHDWPGLDGKIHDGPE